jgi:hypothetical protein
MPGLIPLRMSALIPASKLATSYSEDKPNATYWEPSPYKPRTAEMQFRQATRERMIPEPLIISRPAPSTPSQWKKALAEVKREFINKRYRQCSTRCQEILDNMKDSVRYTLRNHWSCYRFIDMTFPSTSQRQHA